MSCVDMWRCRGIRHDDACVLLITEGMYYAQQPATLAQCYSKAVYVCICTVVVSWQCSAQIKAQEVHSPISPEHCQQLYLPTAGTLA